MTHISETWSVKSVTVKMVSSSHCHGAMVVMYCSIKILAIKTCQSYISLCAVVLTNNNDTSWYIEVYRYMPSSNFFTKWYRQYTLSSSLHYHCYIVNLVIIWSICLSRYYIIWSISLVNILSHCLIVTKRTTTLYPEEFSSHSSDKVKLYLGHE